MRDYYLHPFRTFAAEQTELLGALSGLEIRHPLDSAAMLDFAMRCPVRLRRRNRVDRYMHRKAMMGFLPPAVLERTSKASFDVVFSSSLKQVDEQQLPPGFTQEWLSFETEEVSTLWKSEDASRKLSWADWSAWSLFACSTLADVLEEQPHERTISEISTPQFHAGEAA
jgi:asparagine synthase (glutamine-hydrolysing)